MGSPKRALLLGGVVIVVSVACAGCGGSASQIPAVRATLGRYARALRANDFKVVCATLTPTTSRLMVESARRFEAARRARTAATCPAALAWLHKAAKQAPITPAMVKALVAAPIRVRGNTATVTAAGGKLTLVRIGGRWLAELAPTS
jgi:hypothetical protein